MSIPYKKLLGKLVFVRFDDHAEGEEIFKCVVFGAVVFEDEKVIRIRNWHCEEKPDDNFNHEHYSILKSAIVSVSELKKGRTYSQKIVIPSKRNHSPRRKISKP